MESWKKNSYAVVKTFDGIAVVSTTWLASSNVNKRVLYSCWWPNCSSVKEVRKMARKQAPCDQTTWNQYHSVRLLNFSNSWEDILEMKRKIQKDTDVSRYRKSTSDELDPGNDREGWSSMANVPRVPASPVRNQSQSSFEYIVKLLKESLSELKELRKRVDHNTLLLDELRQQGTYASLSLQEDAVDTHLGVVLPVSTAEDLQELEMKLEDQEFVKRMARDAVGTRCYLAKHEWIQQVDTELKLGVLGGKNLACTGKSILSNLLDPTLACQYNWTGSKGKKKFQSLENINTTIWEAIRKNPKTREATKDDSKSCVISYLCNARDLKGGRNKRRANGRVVNVKREVQAEDVY